MNRFYNGNPFTHNTLKSIISIRVAQYIAQVVFYSRDVNIKTSQVWRSIEYKEKVKFILTHFDSIH